ncbi:MAG: aspartate kinase [Candidatus Eisenbacteria bacterium]|nr:aspartate kinase [Candidatus Eisenbacteria bacterium]
MTKPWIVLKFGGTSVATGERWSVIAKRARELLPEHRVWIVASALSQVSNRLESAMREALGAEIDVRAATGGTSRPDETGGERTRATLASESYEWIASAHRRLADEVGLGDDEFQPVALLLQDLRRTLEGIRLTREASPRLRARVMAFGELASTRLGLAVLARHGIEATWVDARDLLESDEAAAVQDETRYLEASVDATADRARADHAAEGRDVVLTQGFIARTPRGDTCLLGRGGSDTSGGLFAALVEASRLEIWTDVHGMFSADPRQIPSARLVRRIGYREAEELAAMGAKVLHPRCIGPVSRAGIPLVIRNAQDPGAEGTWIGPLGDDDPAVTAVVCRTNVTMLTVSTLAMWGAHGFLARVFQPFDELGISIDLVATSQAAVSVTLDRIPGDVDGAPFGALLERLRRLGTVEVIHPCAVVSIVGRRIRTVLHELGPALSVFREHQVHLVSESSEDLNLSFVVGESDARLLVRELHDRLFPVQRSDDSRFGPSWELLESRSSAGTTAADVGGHFVGRGHSVGQGDSGSADTSTESRAPSKAAWWRSRQDVLLSSVAKDDALYVYHAPSVGARAEELRDQLSSVARFHYSMKANSHPSVLRTVKERGFALECVSAAEIARVREVLGDEVPILFTPNFCPIEEYSFAFENDATVTIDGPDALRQAPGRFEGREVGLRIDPGVGLGHHEKVRTAGPQAKFGHPLEDLASVLEAARELGVRIVGLHAHVGSGIRDAAAWSHTAEALGSLRRNLPDLRWIDLGGGLGVVERPGQEPLDLAAVESTLAASRVEIGGVDLWLEPGRYLVSEAGVLLVKVTQVRQKGGVRFVGVATGMNSLLRPALYGAWHAIHNLSRLGDAPTGYAHVVGPICETGDVLGRDRLLPETRPGDVLLIENCGAYGAVMSSQYNLRAPAGELVLGD